MVGRSQQRYWKLRMPVALGGFLLVVVLSGCVIEQQVSMRQMPMGSAPVDATSIVSDAVAACVAGIATGGPYPTEKIIAAGFRQQRAGKSVLLGPSGETARQIDLSFVMAPRYCSITFRPGGEVTPVATSKEFETALNRAGYSVTVDPISFRTVASRGTTRLDLSTFLMRSSLDHWITVSLKREP